MSIIYLITYLKNKRKNRGITLSERLNLNMELKDYSEKMIATSNELCLINKYILEVENYFKTEKEALNVYFNLAERVIVVSNKTLRPTKALYSQFNFNVQVLFQNSKGSVPHYLLDHWNNLEVPFYNKDEKTEYSFKKLFKNLQCTDITFENRKKLYEKWLNNYFNQFENKKWVLKKEIKEFCENIDNSQYNKNISYHTEDVNYILVTKNYLEKVENNHDNFVKEESLLLSKMFNNIVDLIFKEVMAKTNNHCIVKGNIIYNENLTKYSLRKENRGSVFEIKISNNFEASEIFKEQFFCFSNSFKKYVSGEDTDIVVTINKNNFDEKVKSIFLNLFEGGNDDIEMFLETLNIKTYLECHSEYEKSNILSLLNENKDYNINNKKRL